MAKTNDKDTSMDTASISFCEVQDDEGESSFVNIKDLEKAESRDDDDDIPIAHGEAVTMPNDNRESNKDENTATLLPSSTEHPFFSCCGSELLMLSGKRRWMKSMLLGFVIYVLVALPFGFDGVPLVLLLALMPFWVVLGPLVVTTLLRRAFVRIQDQPMRSVLRIGLEVLLLVLAGLITWCTYQSTTKEEEQEGSGAPWRTTMFLLLLVFMGFALLLIGMEKLSHTYRFPVPNKTVVSLHRGGKERCVFSVTVNGWVRVVECCPNTKPGDEVVVRLAPTETMNVVVPPHVSPGQYFPATLSSRGGVLRALVQCPPHGTANMSTPPQALFLKSLNHDDDSDGKNDDENMYHMMIPRGCVAGQWLVMDLPGSRKVKVAIPPNTVEGMYMKICLPQELREQWDAISTTPVVGTD